jgi:hypothetical protein
LTQAHNSALPAASVNVQAFAALPFRAARMLLEHRISVTACSLALVIKKA